MWQLSLHHANSWQRAGVQAAARVNEAADPDFTGSGENQTCGGERAADSLDRDVKIPILFLLVCLVQPCRAEAEQCEGCTGREAPPE